MAKSGDPEVSISTGIGEQQMHHMLSEMLDDTEQSSTSTLSHGGTRRQSSSSISGLVTKSSQRDSKQDRSHWKPTNVATKCANCRKRFSSVFDRRRNCCMCGEVFCRACSSYQRKLSVHAKPDVLGMLSHVCEACYNFKDVLGRACDLWKEFSFNRSNMLGRKKSVVGTHKRNPICAQKTSLSKTFVMKSQLQKLMDGSKDSTSIQHFLSDVKVPAWQKLPQWVDSSKATVCFGCNAKFGFFSGKIRKINCRIGGQVFCSDCCRDEIVIFNLNSNSIQWAVNGKPGAPSETPASFRLLPVCLNCSYDLQAIVCEKPSAPATPVSGFSEKLTALHSKLSELRGRIDTGLPVYIKLVESLDASDNSPKTVEAQNPLQVLVKAQVDLSDAFSRLAVRSQTLKHLQPVSDSDEKLYRHVMMATYQFYSEGMFIFRQAKDHLGELMPTDHLVDIQKDVSQRSMERVHVYVQQLMFELIDLRKKYIFCEDFFTHLMKMIKCVEEELQRFLEERGESWQKQAGCAVDFIKIELELGKRAITVDDEVTDSSFVLHIVISQVSSRVHECYRELIAKTVESEFPGSKAALKDTFIVLDSMLGSVY